MSNGYNGLGQKINYTATGAVTEGTLIQLTNVVGVALITAVTGATVPLGIYGEYNLTKTAHGAGGFTQGDAVYVTSTGLINNTATGDLFVGIASAASVSGSTSVTVIMQPNVFF
jgi:predicted RecA/RadA family phage recombinase